MLAAFGTATAQSTVVVAGGFTPASQVLFATNFSQDPIGSFPSGLKHVRGPLEVVSYNGVAMLRAIGPAEFLIPLSAPLPQDFTLEFDFIPRTGAGHEIAFEGGPVASKSISSAAVLTSAEILWNHQIATIMGGGQGMAQVTIPYAFQAQLVGKRAKLQVAMSGAQFKLFTNGVQLYNLPTLAFQRTNVLRVFLGGVDNAAQAMYLAGIRLATNGPAPAAAGAPSGGGVASSQPTASAPRTGGTILSGGPTSKLPLTIVPPPPSISTTPAPYNQPTQLPTAQASQSQTSQPPAAAPFVAGPADLQGFLWPIDYATSGVLGVAILWTPVPAATSYRVYRTILGSVLPAQPLFTISDADAAAMATALASAGLGSGGYRMVIDPFVTAANIFWVDAIFSDGSISGLSPSYTMVSQGLTWPWGVVKNLKATLGPTTTVTTWDGKYTGPGRTVSWTWDPLPSAIVYEVRAAFVMAGSATAAPGSFYDETLLTSQPPAISTVPPTPLSSALVPLLSRGYRTGPPFLLGVPTGMTVVFCVATVRDPTNPTTPLAPSISACDTRLVP